MKYAIILEKATKNYSAYAPDVPGCIATGKTLEETVQMMKEALEFHFDGLHADGDPIPQPESEVAYVELDWTPSLLNPAENDDPLFGLEEDPREELHDLLDEIPEGDIAKVKAFLESLVSGSGVDLVERALEEASDDDEEYSEELSASVEEARKEAERGETVSHLEMKRKFGLA